MTDEEYIETAPESQEDVDHSVDFVGRFLLTVLVLGLLGLLAAIIAVGGAL